MGAVMADEFFEAQLTRASGYASYGGALRVLFHQRVFARLDEVLASASSA